ncbi:hypothetical protein [Ferrimicrobium acidiphilum]|uniref:hypothetical protein n=1 Tax=Ferrimicrobium acidiphilum TaxID=121039 RepID=UPI001B802C73
MRTSIAANNNEVTMASQHLFNQRKVSELAPSGCTWERFGQTRNRLTLDLSRL